MRLLEIIAYLPERFLLDLMMEKNLKLHINTKLLPILTAIITEDFIHIRLNLLQGVIPIYQLRQSI